MSDLPLNVHGLMTRLRESGYVVGPTVMKRVTTPTSNATGMSYPINDGELIVTSSQHALLYQSGRLIAEGMLYDEDGMQRIVDAVQETWKL